MEKTGARVLVVEEEDGWTVYMPPDYAEEFLAGPPELPFQLDRERFEKAARDWLLPQLRHVRQMVPAGGCLRVDFDRQGQMGGNWGVSSRRLPESYNDRCHRLMEEATKKTPEKRGMDIERDIMELRALITLLGACSYQDAENIYWPDVAGAMVKYCDGLQEAVEELAHDYGKCQAQVEDLKARLQKLEASPTAGKQTEEAPKEQDS